VLAQRPAITEALQLAARIQ